MDSGSTKSRWGHPRAVALECGRDPSATRSSAFRVGRFPLISKRYARVSLLPAARSAATLLCEIFPRFLKLCKWNICHLHISSQFLQLTPFMEILYVTRIFSAHSRTRRRIGWLTSTVEPPRPVRVRVDANHGTLPFGVPQRPDFILYSGRKPPQQVIPMNKVRRHPACALRASSGSTATLGVRAVCAISPLAGSGR